MAKKDPSLSLEYILKKQEAEKLSGLSSTVREQIGNVPPPSDTISPESKVLSELKKINSNLNVNLNKNILKMTRAIEVNTSALTSFIKGAKKKEEPSKQDLTQQEIEDAEFKDQEIGLLKDIRDSLKIKVRGKESDMPTWLKVLGASLGILLGLLKGYISFLRKFLPENLFKILKAKFLNLGRNLEELAIGLKNKIGKGLNKIASIFSESTIGKYISNSFTKIKKFFNLEKAFGFFAEFKTTIKNFIKPFKTAFDIIKGVLRGPLRGAALLFEHIGQTFKSFSGLIGSVAKVVSKLFEPILIVMAAYDTIKGAIAGFKKEGLVGAIKGGLQALWNSTIGAFLDFVKDIGSWILEKLGFNKAAEALNSFSFKDLYAKFTDMFFKPMKWFQDILTQLSIGPFSIFGKKFGPWKPFASLAAPEKQGLASNEPTTSPAPVTAPMIEVTPESVVPPEATSAEMIYDRSAENEEGAMYPFATPATNIVNAPTTITKQTQNNLMKVNIRNSDTSIKDYYRSRFAT